MHKTSWPTPLCRIPPTSTWSRARRGSRCTTFPASAAPTAAATLGKAPPVIEAAFSQDVLDGRLSPIVEVEKGRGVVLRATDHKLPQQKPLEAVRTEIVAAWKKQRGAELAAAAATAAVKRLNAGESWDAVAKSLGSAPQPREIRGAHRSGRTHGHSPRSVSTAPKPAGKPLYQSLVLAEGDAAVLALTAVREDPAAGLEGIRSAAAPPIRPAVGIERSAGLRARGTRRRQSNRQSAGFGLVGRSVAPVLGLVSGGLGSGRLLAHRRIDGARKHRGAHSERNHHPSGRLSRPYARSAVDRRRDSRRYAGVLARRDRSCTGARAGSDGRWCCGSDRYVGLAAVEDRDWRRPGPPITAGRACSFRGCCR